MLYQTQRALQLITDTLITLATEAQKQGLFSLHSKSPPDYKKAMMPKDVLHQSATQSSHKAQRLSQITLVQQCCGHQQRKRQT